MRSGVVSIGASRAVSAFACGMVRTALMGDFKR
jgi:hypothetical protein